MGRTARDHNGFTPTQARIMEVLGDGRWHSRSELYRIIDDEDPRLLQAHIGNIRKIIAPKALMIIYFTSPTAGVGCQVVRRLMPMEIG